MDSSITQTITHTSPRVGDVVTYRAGKRDLQAVVIATHEVGFEQHSTPLETSMHVHLSVLSDDGMRPRWNVAHNDKGRPDTWRKTNA